MDGLLDLNFDGGGTGWFDHAKDMALDANGKIILAGLQQDATDTDMLVARILANGSGLDTTFGSGGMTAIDFSSSTVDEASGVAIDASNRIVVVGKAGNEIAVARLDSSGALDTTFNSTGKRTYAPSGSYANVRAEKVAVDASGNIVFAGWFSIVSTGQQGQITEG